MSFTVTIVASSLDFQFALYNTFNCFELLFISGLFIQLFTKTADVSMTLIIIFLCVIILISDTNSTMDIILILTVI